MENIATSVWNKSKLLIKSMMIGLLVLLLLIPTHLVKDLIEEREQRQKEAVAEVSSKWAGKQNIAGPLLVLPYTEATTDTSKSYAPVKYYAYFLPDELNINAAIIPQQKTRGIYKVMLYSSQIDVSGKFDQVAIEKLKIPAERILWNEAFIKVNIADAKGLNEELRVRWNDSLITLTPQSVDYPSEDGLIASVPLTGAESLKNIRFSTRINLNGSEHILFTPIGKKTTAKLNAKWPHPSFTGNTLPQQSLINNDSFSAEWKSFSHKRDFPQQWKGNPYAISDTPAAVTSNMYKLGSSAFGVNLFIPVNDYQKTMRSIKYAVLCILLTFAAFFLMDTVHKKSVHPFQYGLIGLALVLFYVLLLSFSEYTGFNIAYSIAGAATIGLIGWFVKGILASGKLSLLLSVVLVFIYSYVFTILQLQDYALLLGSIGLFITLAIIMHFSRKIQW